MAKKNKQSKAGDGDLAGEEILDSLAQEAEVSADGGDASEAETVVPAAERPNALRAEFMAWPCAPDHGSAASFLRGEGAGDPNQVVLPEEDEIAGRSGGASNIVLMLLILAVGAVGVWQFTVVSSPEAQAAKRAEREAIEQAHLAEQLSKQKKYGVLRIESSPAQAVVFKDGERMVTKNEATGEEIVVKTPTNLMDLDISQPIKIKLEFEGYEPFEFGVSEHLWTKDAATSEFKFFKSAELTPNVCEYWFLYDAKVKREMKFDEKADCLTHYEDASRAGTSVTECTCKIPPEGWEPPKKDGKDPKKGK